MSPEREGDLQADAVLLAILRFLVERGAGEVLLNDLSRTEIMDGADVFSSDVVEIVSTRMRLVESVARSINDAGSVDEQMTTLGTYHTLREPLDELWTFVQSYGFPTLLREVRQRTRLRPRGSA